MQWFSAAFTAGVVTAVFYGLQYIVEQKMDLEFRHSGKWITDITVILTLILTFSGTLVVAGIRLPQLGASRYLLAAVLLGGLAVLTVTDCKKQGHSDITSAVDSSCGDYTDRYGFLRLRAFVPFSRGRSDQWIDLFALLSFFQRADGGRRRETGICHGTVSDRGADHGSTFLRNRALLHLFHRAAAA